MGAASFSPTKIRELLDSLEAIQPDWSGSNLRSATRFQLCAPIVIAAMVGDTTGEAFAVLLHDLSETGLSFLHVGPLVVGSHYVLVEHPSFPISREFMTVHCVPVEDGRYRIGGAFSDSLTEHDRFRAELLKYVLSRSILK